MKKVLSFALFCLLLSGVVSGQGWERVLSGGGQDEARALARTPDGGYIVAGFYATTRATLVKTDADGFVQWSKNYFPGQEVYAANAVVVTQDSHLIVAGFKKPQLFAASNIWVMKTDMSGNPVWQKTFGDVGDDEAKSLEIMPDGNIVVAGFTTNASGMRDAWVSRLDGSGNAIWTKTLGVADKREQINDLTLAQNGDLILVGSKEDIPDFDVCVFRLKNTGDVVWETGYGFDFLPALSADVGYGVVEAEDGGIVVAGKTSLIQDGGLLMKITGSGDAVPVWFKTYADGYFTGISSDVQNGYYVCGIRKTSVLNEDLYLLHTDEAGEKIWERRIGRGELDIAYAVTTADDGGAVAAGSVTTSLLLGDAAVYLVKTTGNGTIYSNYVEGNVYHDFNLNCKRESNEPALKKWVVKIESQDFTRYATSSESGFFSALVDTGNYKISVIKPNEYWKVCNTNLSVPVLDFFDTLKVDVGMYAIKACPNNSVEVRTPILRRCAENTYTVNYCNNGTIPSFDTKVEVELDSFLTATGSSIPWQSQVGTKYTFNIGYLNTGECGSFTLTAWLSCDSTISGQTHCVKAHIFPDSFCIVDQNWDGAIIEARAECKEQKVRLSLKNRGTGISPGNTLEFVIIEDQVIYRTGITTTPPPGKDTLILSQPANGHTYRIIAEQSPGYPGISYPTAAVEGCITDTTPSFSTGYFTMFPEDDADAFVSVDCQESFDPGFNPVALKRGHPKGVGPQGYINPTTDLDFVIRFFNQGADTVRQVIVRDTLSAWLDPTSVRPGTASHPYDFQIYAGGIVQFTIPDLYLLPGSSAGDGSSGGYVQFRVSQIPNLPCHTEIRNRAAVYFDFNAPVFTNETFHTVCDLDDVLPVGIPDVFMPGAVVNVYPNPFTSSAVFEIEGVSARQYLLEIYDTQGNILIRRFFNQSSLQLFRNQLPEGLFFYRLAADGVPVASGKIQTVGR